MSFWFCYHRNDTKNREVINVTDKTNIQMEVMIMTLLELQKVLGERIEIANSKDVDAETRKTENETSQVIASLAKQMINNADVVLRAEKLMDEGKLKGSSIKSLVK